MQVAVAQIAVVGIWGLGSVALGVWRLSDAPEAAEELAQVNFKPQTLNYKR